LDPVKLQNILIYKELTEMIELHLKNIETHPIATIIKVFLDYMQQKYSGKKPSTERSDSKPRLSSYSDGGLDSY
jgi:hypothetical protein